MKTFAGVQIATVDELFAGLVKERSNYHCDRCRLEYRYHPSIPIDCSHLFGRAMMSVRFFPLNAFAHCRPCHIHFEQHRKQFDQWAVSHLGREGFDAVQTLAFTVEAFTFEQEVMIYEHLQAEKARIKEARFDGEIGRLEFTWPKELLSSALINTTTERAAL